MTEPTALRDDAVRFLLDLPRPFDADRFADDLPPPFDADRFADDLLRPFDAVRVAAELPRPLDAGRFAADLAPGCFAADLVVVFFAEAGFLEREDEAFDRLFEVERDALFDR